MLQTVEQDRTLTFETSSTTSSTIGNDPIAEIEGEQAQYDEQRNHAPVYETSNEGLVLAHGPPPAHRQVIILRQVPLASISPADALPLLRHGKVAVTRLGGAHRALLDVLIGGRPARSGEQAGANVDALSSAAAAARRQGRHRRQAPQVLRQLFFALELGRPRVVAGGTALQAARLPHHSIRAAAKEEVVHAEEAWQGLKIRLMVAKGTTMLLAGERLQTGLQ